MFRVISLLQETKRGFTLVLAPAWGRSACFFFFFFCFCLRALVVHCHLSPSSCGSRDQRDVRSPAQLHACSQGSAAPQAAPLPAELCRHPTPPPPAQAPSRMRLGHRSQGVKLPKRTSGTSPWLCASGDFASAAIGAAPHFFRAGTWTSWPCLNACSHPSARRLLSRSRSVEGRSSPTAPGSTALPGPHGCWPPLRQRLPGVLVPSAC